MRKTSLNQKLKSLRSIQPDSSWVKTTRAEVLSQRQPLIESGEVQTKPMRTSFISLLFIAMQKQYIAFLLVGLIAVVGLGLYTGFGYNKLLQSSTYLTGAERQAAIANLVANNSVTSLQQINRGQAAAKEFAASAAAGDAAQQSMPAIGIGIPTIEQNKLFYTKTKSTKGPAKCALMEYGGLVDFAGTIFRESYSYYTADGGSLSQTIAKLSNGQVAELSYMLSKANNFETYDYKGGSYAVKSISTFSGEVPAPVPMPAVDTAIPESVTPPASKSAEETFREMFGPDAQISKVVDAEGKEKLLVETTYKTYCSSTNMDLSPLLGSRPNYWEGESGENPAVQPEVAYGDTTIINLLWVDPENTYTVYKQETYLTDKSPANLLFSEETLSNSNSEIAFDVAKSQLEQNLPAVSVRTLEIGSNPDNSDELTKKLTQANLDSILQQDLPVVLPTKTGYRFYATIEQVNKELSKSPTADPYSQHFQDRSFYLPGPIGDKMFAQAQDFRLAISSYIAETPGLVATFSASTDTMSGSTFNVKVFESQKSNIDIVNTFLYSPTKTRSVQTFEMSTSAGIKAAQAYIYTAQLDLIALAEPAAVPENVTLPYPGDAPGCEGSDCDIPGYIVIFEVGKYKVAIKEEITPTDATTKPGSTFDVTSFNAFGWQIFSGGNAADMQKLSQLIW